MQRLASIHQGKPEALPLHLLTEFQPSQLSPCRGSFLLLLTLQTLQETDSPNIQTEPLQSHLQGHFILPVLPDDPLTEVPHFFGLVALCPFPCFLLSNTLKSSFIEKLDIKAMADPQTAVGDG